MPAKPGMCIPAARGTSQCGFWIPIMMTGALKAYELYHFKKRGCIMFKLTDYIPKAELETFCRRNHITKMSLFGSALRDELKTGSDIDILVEFDKNHMPGLFDVSRMEIELSETIGHKVDLRTPEDLSKYFRDEVVKSAEVHYEEAR